MGPIELRWRRRRGRIVGVSLVVGGGAEGCWSMVLEAAEELVFPGVGRKSKGL